MNNAVAIMKGTENDISWVIMKSASNNIACYSEAQQKYGLCPNRDINQSTFNLII